MLLILLRLSKDVNSIALYVFKKIRIDMSVQAHHINSTLEKLL